MIALTLTFDIDEAYMDQARSCAYSITGDGSDKGVQAWLTSIAPAAMAWQIQVGRDQVMQKEVSDAVAAQQLAQQDMLNQIKQRIIENGGGGVIKNP